jgi:5'-nucleotidase / UDP-sugar diphosphatase
MGAWIAVALLAVATPPAAPSESTVTILDFADYHSHAVPFYSEGEAGQAGIARAIAYLRRRREEPATLVVSGGDMMNRQSPSWSDEYHCVEWPWLIGLVDAMALGNHDLDYGPGVFEQCRQSVDFPVLSANLVRPDGTPVLLWRGRPYAVKEVSGIRIGFFAVAGPDVQLLVREENLPPDTTWAEAIPAARLVVEDLRKVEKVDAVVLLGHEKREDDEALARAVPGIDLVLGSHSHLKSELVTIPGTQTAFISPYQYLTYVSETRLRFRGHALAGIAGRLVRMDASLPEDPAVAAEVRRLEAQLEARHPERFRVLGRALVAMSDAGVATGESVIGNWATEVLRAAAGTHVFFATASSFRAAIPPGDVTAEAFYTALPYPNRVVTAEMTGQQILDWLELSQSRAGTDAFSQQTGLRYRLRNGHPDAVRILRDPERREAGFVPLDPEARYRVGTTDFQAEVAAGYKELWARAGRRVRTPLDAHRALLEALAEGPIAAALDGRDGP